MGGTRAALSQGHGRRQQGHAQCRAEQAVGDRFDQSRANGEIALAAGPAAARELGASQLRLCHAWLASDGDPSQVGEEALARL
ncbi:hypothetical protein [Streptomyces sp. NBC_00588]|uniref:hypothetical protein n=1 Tax=Streptomyces sp. NBC_00588 TaxID=2975784 RepID=UPI002E80D4DA|nr:hypothetical protein [Streptomyces sp. NBC_00588]WUB39229.1 hypothetical protein OHN38_31545 [Streptomyces sp. NBC_00588]